MSDAGFEVICEIEPATTPDLTRVRHQIGVLAPVATAFLIPDKLVQTVESSPDAGLDSAMQLIDGIRSSGAFDGVHLIPVNLARARQVAARLEGWRRGQ